MVQDLVAKASISIYAPVEKVWDALINPKVIRQYMFGTEVISKWTEGSTIVWKGVWKGKPYEDKGEILKIEPGKILEYSHFSPLTGLPDKPENYHKVTYELVTEGPHTLIYLSQDNNRNEKEMEHSQSMWKKMLNELKNVLEKGTK
jgi:uncharacterized protein YndB with AHSA1/START domain